MFFVRLCEPVCERYAQVGILFLTLKCLLRLELCQDTVDVDGRTRERVNLLGHERQGVCGCVELCLGNC